jgi:tetratricopeptide (TPR) repeat protein
MARKRAPSPEHKPARRIAEIRQPPSRARAASTSRPAKRLTRLPAVRGALLGACALVLLVLMGAGVRLWRVPGGASTGAAPAASAVAVTPEEKRLAAAVERQPAGPGSHLELARYYLGERRPAEAAWEYQEAAARRPAALSAPMGLAIALGQLELPRAAIALLEGLLRRNPSAVDLRRELAEFYLVTGQPERSVTVLVADLRSVRGSPEALLTLGRSHLALDQAEAARSAFVEYARRSPQSPQADYWLGTVALTSGDPAGARRLWQRSRERAPQDPRFPYSLGMLDARDRAPGSTDDAAREFSEALRRSPRYEPAYLQLGRLYQRERRHHDAARLLLRAIQAAPADPEPHRHLAAALSALGEAAEAHRHRGLYYSLGDRPAMALGEYEKLQAAHPDAIDAPLLISQSYIQMQQNERAAAVVKEAVARHPHQPELYESLASLYILTHSATEAAQICGAWLEAQPEAARPHWLLGQIALGNNQFAEAVRQFEAALARDPNNAEYTAALGGALARQPASDAPRRALAALCRAVELRPSVANYHYQAGLALQQLGDWEPARREFLATLSLDPTASGAYNALAQVAQALRRPHQVTFWAATIRTVQDRLREEKFQRRQAGQRPRDPVVYYTLAKTLLRDGQVAKAESQLEQAVALRPRWPEAQAELARVRRLLAVL